MNTTLHTHRVNRLARVSFLAIIAAIATQNVNAERQPKSWKKRTQSDTFNGKFNSRYWYKDTQKLNPADPKKHKNRSGRGVQYFIWMVDYAKVAGRHCLRIKANSYGTIDRGGALFTSSTGGGDRFKYGWFEAATKLSGLNEFVWPTFWVNTTWTNKQKFKGSDELDVMEYAYGDYALTHYQNGKKKARKTWYKNSGRSFMQSKLVNKFTLWSVRSDWNGTKFLMDNRSLLTGKTKVKYPMILKFTSGTNRFIKTPKNKHYPNFLIDYVNVFTP